MRSYLFHIKYISDTCVVHYSILGVPALMPALSALKVKSKPSVRGRRLFRRVIKGTSVGSSTINCVLIVKLIVWSCGQLHTHTDTHYLTARFSKARATKTGATHQKRCGSGRNAIDCGAGWLHEIVCRSAPKMGRGLGVCTSDM